MSTKIPKTQPPTSNRSQTLFCFEMLDLALKRQSLFAMSLVDFLFRVTPNQDQFAVTKEVVIVDDSKLPKFDAIIISGNSTMSEFSKPYSMRKNLR